MHFRFLSTASVVACALLVSGCAAKSYAVLIESPDGSTGAIIVSNSKGATLINQKQRAVPLDGAASDLFSVPQKSLEQDFSAALAAQPPLPQAFMLYFENATTRLTPESAALIPGVLDTVRRRGQAVVSVTGHTDTLGDERLNDRLSSERAEAIVKLLKANGLKAIELVVSSHGKRNLLVKTPDNTAEPRNRRVEITVR